MKYELIKNGVVVNIINWDGVAELNLDGELVLADNQAYALIKNGVVVNIINWDGEAELNLDGELVLADDSAWIGGTYNGSFVARPVEPEPEPTPEQAQKAADKASANAKLKSLGLTDAEIEAITQ